MNYSLTDDQKVCLKDDGYIVLKDAVPQTVVDEARNLILHSLPRSERRLLVPGELATHPSVLALFYLGFLFILFFFANLYGSIDLKL